MSVQLAKQIERSGFRPSQRKMYNTCPHVLFSIMTQTQIGILFGEHSSLFLWELICNVPKSKHVLVSVHDCFPESVFLLSHRFPSKNDKAMKQVFWGLTTIANIKVLNLINGGKLLCFWLCATFQGKVVHGIALQVENYNNPNMYRFCTWSGILANSSN